MRRRIFVFLALLVLFSGSCAAQKDYTKDQIITDILVKTLKDFHYSSRPINNTFSQDVFDLYLKRLDAQKKFFYEEDIKKLSRFRNSIDDQLLKEDLEFYVRANTILLERIRQIQALYPLILSNAFDFTVQESINFDFDKISYAKNEAEMKDKWRRILKYQALRYYMDLTAKSGKTDIDPRQEKIARDKVAVFMKRMLERLEQQSDLDRFEVYMNAVANVFDPHTSYFPPKQDQDFKIEMTGRLEGIGAMLSEQDGNIKVVNIVPGSAAWRQQQLEAEDIILKVGEGDKEPVDVVEMPLDDAVQLIRGKKGTEVRLTVKKPDGRVLLIPIIRDAVVLEETYARSTILENPLTHTRVGYLDLPAFYHDFDDEGSRNSADDVRAEIEKLKKANIQGLILDLRNNGGGALEDAVRMSGLFISTGPIVQVRDKLGKIEVLRDNDPGIAWDGPLIVLVNTLSASASEIVSAALQDYDRAIIVGSDHTYGKGTVQTYVNIDRFVPYHYKSITPLGALKITLQKFYRVNGDSTQYKGVVPDIILPDLYEYVKIGEKYADYSLPWDRIKAQKYSQWDRTPFDLASLKKHSAARILTNQTFQFISSNARFVEAQQEDQTESLQLSNSLAKEHLLQEKNRQLQQFALRKDEPVLIHHMEDRPAVVNPAFQKNWDDKIQSDKYIAEVFALMDEMLGK